MNKVPILEFQNVTKSYSEGQISLEVLKEISFALYPGDRIALMGPSGAGKSTLLHLAGLLDRVTSGDIIFKGKNCSSLRDREKTEIRRHDMGFVYQFHQLLPEFTALENIILPQLICLSDPSKARKKAWDLLTSVGLAERGHHLPGELSGGEQQRVAMLRALANQPTLLLADEPTGNLDTYTTELVCDELLKLAYKSSLTLLIATHNPAIARKMDKVLHLEDGNLAFRQEGQI